MKNQDGYEYRYFAQYGLICPNPRKYYEMTRSYESMRQEWELKHPEECFESQIAYAQLAQLSKKTPFYQKNMFFIILMFLPVWTFLAWIGILILRY